jgi:hypothetical protein
VSARWDDGLEDEAQALPQEDLDVICEIANQLPLELNGYSWSDMTEEKRNRMREQSWPLCFVRRKARQGNERELGCPLSSSWQG